MPRSHGKIQKKDYWDSFFSKTRSPFEWYGEYQDLGYVLHKYMKPAAKILVVGCGNSKDLYDVGFHSIENISAVVIKQMLAKNQQKRPKMKFTKMDVLEMSYAVGVFDRQGDAGCRLQQGRRGDCSEGVETV